MNGELPRILLADDNAEMRQYLQCLLSEYYHVEAVSNGRSAMEILRQSKPDLIISDLTTPSLDGFSLLREIRADEELCGLPVIQLSNRASAMSNGERVQAAADDYLVKPFGASELLARVSTHLQMARVRRDSERALRESEERLRTLSDNLPSGAVYQGTFDEQGQRRCTYISAGVERLFGVTPAEVMADATVLYRLIHEDDQARMALLDEQVVRTLTPLDCEFRSWTRHGSLIWVHARSACRRLTNGQIVWEGIILDVTPRKRAEEQLARITAESEKRRRLYEAALSNTPDLVYVFDLDHRFTYVNESLLGMWGKSWDDAIGKTCLELGYPEWHAAMHDREIEEVKTTKRPVRGEVPFAGTFGRRVYEYIFVPVLGVDGEVEAVAGTTRDVTDRKVSEEELRTQTERMRLLWEAASVLLTTNEPDAMMRGLFSRIAGHFRLDTYFNFMVDESGEFLRLESCLGIPAETAESIRRLDFGQAVCGAVALHRKPITATCIQESDDPRVQLVKSFGIRAYACNPLIAGDRLLGTLSFASRTRDTFNPEEVEFLRTICYYVTVAYERLRLVRELREADRKKDDFIALLAHELRNPLAPIRNGLQVIRLAAEDPVSVTRAREMMDRQLGHMVRLIDDLLDVSRINRNKMELRRTRVTLAEVVSTAIETARPLLDAAKHELTVALPAIPVVLHADLTRLAQVFANLLANSAKYTPPGGRVWVSAEPKEGRVAVSVRDTGIGIPAAFLPTIFDMFSQVDRSVERASGGLGIGLALVKGLVEMHGGSVSAASEGPGRGSIFTITLPVAHGSESTLPDAAREAIPRFPARRVLVVDDNRDGAESMAEMLRLLGNDLRTAHDGVEAVEAAEEFRPDVILMDVGMPRLNGLDAARLIREKPWGREVFMIALTGWGQDADRERSREAGCDRHLVKPVKLADLERVLAESRTQD